MGYDFEVSDVLPGTPDAIYRAWMSSDGHTAMTGAGARIDPRIGGEYETWDGYITGRMLALKPGRRIVQSWRTAELADSDGDSQIEVLLDPVEDGTRITIRHTNVPDGQPGYEQGGWQEIYFDAMRVHFARGTNAAPPATP
jgi:activator of HSP90 ATPase